MAYYRIKSFEIEGQSHHAPLDNLIKRVQMSKAKKVTLGDIYDSAIDNNDYGFLTGLLAFVIILPVGAIPGVPAIVGAVMCLVYLSVMISSFSLNLPKPISKIKVKPNLVVKVCSFMNQCLLKLDVFAKENRLQALNSGFSIRVISVLGIIFSFATILVGFIPFMPTLLMLPVLLFSLGAILKDGMFTAGGYICAFVLLIIAMQAVL